MKGPCSFARARSCTRIARMLFRAAFAMVLLALSGPAIADGVVLSKMTKDDKARLDNFDATRAKAITEARTTGSRQDIAVLDKVLAGKPLELRDSNLVGDWRCRAIKLGGMAPQLVVYGWFKCRIFEDGAGLWLDKITGSQRTRGLLYDDGDTRMIYLGKLHYGYEKPGTYGQDPTRNQVAYAFRVGPKRMRLEFPAPQYESLLDIMELERP